MATSITTSGLIYPDMQAILFVSSVLEELASENPYMSVLQDSEGFDRLCDALADAIDAFDADDVSKEDVGRYTHVATRLARASAKLERMAERAAKQ